MSDHRARHENGVNRELMAYLMEALILIDEGDKPEATDAAATSFGMPMGPIVVARRARQESGQGLYAIIERLCERERGARFAPDPGW